MSGFTDDPPRALEGVAVGDEVPSGELVVGEVVAVGAQGGDEAPTGAVDRQHLVLYAVGDEEGGAALAALGGLEPRGEGHHLREEVAVGEPEGQSVRGAVGEPRDSDRGGVERMALED